MKNFLSNTRPVSQEFTAPPPCSHTWALCEHEGYVRCQKCGTYKKDVAANLFAPPAPPAPPARTPSSPGSVLSNIIGSYRCSNCGYQWQSASVEPMCPQCVSRDYRETQLLLRTAPDTGKPFQFDDGTVGYEEVPIVEDSEMLDLAKKMMSGTLQAKPGDNELVNPNESQTITWGNLFGRPTPPVFELSPQYAPIPTPQKDDETLVGMFEQSLQDKSVPLTTNPPGGFGVIVDYLSQPFDLQSAPPHIRINAYAGTGKTFTIMEQCYRMVGINRPGVVGSPEQEAIWAAIQERYTAPQIYMTAFNTKIKAVLQKQAPPGVLVSTIHGLGKRICGFNRIGTGKYGVYKGKYKKTWKILADYRQVEVKSLFNQFKGPILYAIGQIVSLLKVNLINLTGDYEKDKSTCLQLVETHGVTLPEFKNNDDLFVFTSAIEVFNRSHLPDYHRCIDFDDMIWLPIKLDLPVRPLEVMFVDEMQDLNKAQQELVCRAARRLIMVGDEHQAIYGFAGADVDACRKMEARLNSSPRGCKSFRLTLTRRCSKAIVRFNRRIVSDFGYFQENLEGAIYQDNESTYLDKVAIGDMVVCRTNAPLFASCLRLLKSGTPFRTTIKAFFEQTINLIKSFEAKGLVDLVGKLEEWRDHKLAVLTASRSEQMIIVEDQVAAIRVAIDQCRTVDDLINLLERVFKIDGDDEDDRGIGPDEKWVFLSSIHSAKGLEAPRVWWLQSDKVPHPRAKLVEQETNLMWVAGTRAIHDLVLVHSTERRVEQDGE